MSGQATPILPPAVPELREAPGAFPVTPEISDDANISSDLSSLSRAVKARRSEYTRQKKIRVRVGSWNVAALPDTEDDIGRWFMEPTPLAKSDGGRTDSSGECEEDIDIYVLGLQEIIDISSPSEALRPYVDQTPSNKWKEALQKALPVGYECIFSQQLMGILLLVYASPSIAPSISSISSSSVGTGLMGYMGNKGGVATRIVLGGTTRVVFLNCHMAAGADKASLDRRNWDVGQIISRTKFDPIDEEDDVAAEPSFALGQEDFAFWFGDLNYRLDDIPGDDVRRLLHLHTEDKFHPTMKSAAEDTESSASCDGNNARPSSDIESSVDGDITLVDNDIEPDLDPTSLRTTLASLLPHDQLRCQQKKGTALHEGWREGPINFLPTYKYDVGHIGSFDSSEKQRSPSWCDRILYRTRHDRSEYFKNIAEGEQAKKRDEEMKSLGLEQEAEDDSVLFNYDPDSDGVQEVGDYDENGDDANAIDATMETNQRKDPKENIEILRYTSHQHIVSSDHKPLHADFVLTYDAVDPGLKALVHQDVARELDRAENEARPHITVVMDQPFRGNMDGTAPDNGGNDPDTVNFGRVPYDVPVVRDLTLANTGGVSATFGFHYRPDDSEEAENISPPWLNVRVDWPSNSNDSAQGTAPEYTLAPGDSVQVQFILCINDISFVRELNRGKADIEDILVLRVANGRDHFISIRGDWLPTCFGLSLLELTRMPQGGARELDVKSQPSNPDEEVNNGGARMSAPRELFRLTEAIGELIERSVAEWGMVGENSENEVCPWMAERTGWPFDRETWSTANQRGNERNTLLSSIREAVDTGASFSSHFPPELPARYRVELLSETLLSFLGSLEDGLITESLWNRLDQQILAHEKLKRGSHVDQPQSWILDTLSSSPVHSVSFTFLTLMLNRVANEIAPVPRSAEPLPGSPSATHSETNTAPSSPTPSLASGTASQVPFPFRFKSRSRAISSSASSEGDPGVPPPTTNPAVIPGKPSPALLRRQAVNKSFAKIFADVIFSSRIVPPEKDKERKAWEGRRRGVLEAFLNEEGV